MSINLFTLNLGRKEQFSSLNLFSNLLIFWSDSNVNAKQTQHETLFLLKSQHQNLGRNCRKLDSISYLFGLTVKINGSGVTVLHVVPPSSFAEHRKPASVGLDDGVPRRRRRRLRWKRESKRSDGNVELCGSSSLQHGRGRRRWARGCCRKRKHERFCHGRRVIVVGVVVVEEREHGGSGNCHGTRHAAITTLALWVSCYCSCSCSSRKLCLCFVFEFCLGYDEGERKDRGYLKERMCAPWRWVKGGLFWSFNFLFLYITNILLILLMQFISCKWSFLGFYF